MSGTVTVRRVAGVEGELRPPSDKSLTHRAYILALMAAPGDEPVTIEHALRGEDCESTRAIVGHLGCPSNHDGQTTLVHRRQGSYQQPTTDLDCGNSGTTMRLMTGVLAAQDGLECRLVGDASLSRRPMGRVAQPLRLMGAEIEGDHAPLTVRGRALQAIDYKSPVASAQIKSCVLLAGLRAEGTTWITEPEQSRDHTERMLTALGVNLQHEDGTRWGVEGGQTWGAFKFKVPADISSAAFWAVLAACVGNGQLRLTDVGLNPTRTGLLDVLQAAGAQVSAEPRDTELGEPVGDVTIHGGAELSAFEVHGSLVPRLIDEIPVLAVMATQCRGTTVFRDARELRVKESDRIALVADGLTKMGAKVEVFDDGLSVEGPVELHGAEIDAHGDHRIAMGFAVAGMIADGATTISGAETIATSYPDFWTDREQVVSL